ncbi:MAG: FkbM family methyltransferase [Deferrisomatales bacterium]|nr:FkbM family methyltransferase [Deferrisomatales bacterium]
MLMLDRWIGSKPRVVDIGANYGIYSYYLARMGKSVEAFEPLPGCARTISAYRSPRIRVHNVALSSVPGTLRLFTPVVKGAAHTPSSSFAPVAGPHEACMVPVRTLDEYSFEDICLVKIDVEGHELEVLRGATETLHRERPVSLVEIEQGHLAIPITEVFEHVLGQGYAGFFFSRGKVRPLSAFSFEANQHPFLEDVHNPAYVNNFLFLPEGRLGAGAPARKHGG